MNKFNLPRRDIQKERRQKRTERRKQKARILGADVTTKSGALALRGNSENLSGKQKAKLTKKWRRAQKGALQSGLVSMQDIEMMAVDGGEGGTDEGSDQQQPTSLPKSKKKFSMKKRAKLRLKSSSSAAVEGGGDGEDGMMQ